MARRRHVTLVSDTAPGDWVVVQGSGNANNCNENPNQFKICAQEDSLLLSASTEDDQIYTWTIDVAYNTLGDLSALTSDQNPIMAIFYELNCKTDRRTDAVTCEPKQTGNFSLTTDYGTRPSRQRPMWSTTDEVTTTDTPTGAVPEPTVMTLLGAGLLLVGTQTATPVQVIRVSPPADAAGDRRTMWSAGTLVLVTA